MSKRITKRDVIKGLHSIVEELGPDYTYDHRGDNNACEYARYDVEKGKHYPSCLVGRYLAKEGIKPKTLAELDGIADSAFGGDDVVSYLATNLGITFTRKASRLLDRAQSDQDGGVKYGDILARSVNGTYDED